MDKGTAKEKLIVALDFPLWEDAEGLIKKLPEVTCFKVGLELYLSTGGAAIKNLRQMGKEVFLDLKFHDIPNTVEQASRKAAEVGALIFNVHASGGAEMMRQSRQAVEKEVGRLGVRQPLIFAVTILTSLDDSDLKQIGFQGTQDSVLRLAQLAQKSGMDGVVASPQEIEMIRKACGSSFKILCPGVRPHWAAVGDQKRVMTPFEAIKAGADYLVIGRPISKAKSPREAALKVIEEMEAAI